MGSYTAQLCFGAIQYERVCKWKSKVESETNQKWSSVDKFLRDYVVNTLDVEIPPTSKKDLPKN